MLRSIVGNSQFKDDPEFEPHRTFTAAKDPGAAVIPEYAGSNVLLKGVYRAYKILVER